MRPYHALKVSKKKKAKNDEENDVDQAENEEWQQASAGQGHLKYIYFFKNTQQVNYFLTRWYNLKYFYKITKRPATLPCEKYLPRLVRELRPP